MKPVVSFDARLFIFLSIFVWGRSASAQLAVRSFARTLT